MTEFKIIFIHGYTASHKADWYPSLTKLLDAAGVDYVVPDLPGGLRPHAAKWLEAVDREVIASDKPVVLVGHSLGSRTVLLYLEQFKQPVVAVIMVAAFANDVANAKRNFGLAYPDFFTHKINLDIVKECCKQFVVIHSRDDDIIDYSQGDAIASDLDAELVALEGRKHFVRLDDAPYIYAVLQKTIGF